MIGINKLGSLGRLGNQMFQYASLRGIANNRKLDYCVPDHSEVTNFDGNLERIYHQLQTCFEVAELNNHKGIENGPEIHHFGTEFNEDIFNQCPDNVSLYGYFESEKYFKHIEKEIRSEYTFKKEIIDLVNSKYLDVLSKGPVSVSVRRFLPDFDFPGVENHHVNLDIEYYKKAMDFFGPERLFIITSNDFAWCQNQEIFQSENIIFNDKIHEGVNKGHFDLCLASLCSDNIMSNSTFSWWGAWLNNNPDKKIIAPNAWYGPASPQNNTIDLIPEEWIRF
jgi:hypothetical protein